MQQTVWKHRCQHTNTVPKIFTNHKTVEPGNHSCNSANIVYLIHCKKCPEPQYIGETGGHFRYRFSNQTQYIRQKNLLPLLSHYNADVLKINDLKLCIYKGNFKDTKHRKPTELQFIINFETNKLGFNKDISFLIKNMIHLDIKVEYFKL